MKSNFKKSKLIVSHSFGNTKIDAILALLISWRYKQMRALPFLALLKSLTHNSPN